MNCVPAEHCQTIRMDKRALTPERFMAEPRGVIDANDILYDMEGTQRLRAQLEQVSSESQPLVRRVDRDLRLRPPH